jgi:hypothetical protein
LAKVKINTKDAEKALKNRLNRSLRSEKLLTEVGEIAVKNSVASSRLGKDPTTLEAYAPFSGENPEKYIATRKRIAARNGKGSNFRPAKSNLTITGQLLNSIKAFVERGKVIIKASGEHKPYGKGKTISNEELARWHSDGKGPYPARNVVGISDKTRDIIKNKVRAFLRRNALKVRR